MYNNITDVEGIKVGHASDFTGLTGCTVVLCSDGAVAGVDVRGSAPGTRETDLLRPVNLVREAHAILLTGGSAFGLDAASGVMQYLSEHGVGFNSGARPVPIVPAAVLFDLDVGDPTAYPDKAMGYKACLSATTGYVEQGCIGAGTGATVGKILGLKHAMKGGVGSASLSIGDLVVGAIVAVNALGDVVDYRSGDIIAGCRDDSGCFVGTVHHMLNGDLQHRGFGNTTIGVVATNAMLDKEGINKVAQMAHDGYALAIRPVHTMYDGDTVFALTTQRVTADVTQVGVAAVEVMAQAILNAVRAANQE
jgi:L-aminopeptidase/D-esterase-like protein